MEKGCINKHPANIVSERQTREETVMFLDANNHSLTGKRKVTDTLREQVTRPGNIYVPYNAENTLLLFIFKFVRRLRATFFLFCC